MPARTGFHRLRAEPARGATVDAGGNDEPERTGNAAGPAAVAVGSQPYLLGVANPCQGATRAPGVARTRPVTQRNFSPERTEQ